MCNKCIHKAVCGKFRATGGVKKCEHHKEERRGRWEKYARYMICSECDIGFCYYKNETDRFQYCPNCGADMRGEAT